MRRKPDYTGYLALITAGIAMLTVYSIDHYFMRPALPARPVRNICATCHFPDDEPMYPTLNSYKNRRRQ
jgi:hypothetical protein